MLLQSLSSEIDSEDGIRAGAFASQLEAEGRDRDMLLMWMRRKWDAIAPPRVDVATLSPALRGRRTRRKSASKNIKSITPLFGASSIVFCINRQPCCCLAKTAIFPSKSADNRPKSPPPPFCEFSRLCNDSPPQKGIDFRR